MIKENGGGKQLWWKRITKLHFAISLRRTEVAVLMGILYIYMYKLGQSYRALIHRRLFQRGGIEGRVSELIERANFFSSRFAPPTL